MSQEMIYLDNAATTWPKPDCVLQAMSDAIKFSGGNPGRGGHRLALAAGEILYEAREKTASFFGSDNSFSVCYTQNITMAINLVLQGFLHKGDHVLISPMEHNAVMRPLTALGVEYDILSGDSSGKVNLSAISEKIKRNTKLVIICHESNVNGTVQPLKEIGAISRQHNLFLLADCAQSAGHIPLNIENDNIDFLCFTGHKGLLGPQGTGGIVFGSRIDTEQISPLLRGGTGSLSESFLQPYFLPDRFESGTQNLPGIAGLCAGIQWIEEHGINTISKRGKEHIREISDALKDVPGIHVFSGEGHTLSLTIEGLDNGTAASILEERWGIMSRIGLHCAPLAHKTLGTFPSGTIRFAVSPYTTEQEIQTVIQACKTLAEEAWKMK